MTTAAPGETAFAELSSFLDRAIAFIKQVIWTLLTFNDLDRQVHESLGPLPDELDRLLRELRQQIASRDHDAALAGHGLADGDPALRFKLALLNFAIRRHDEEAAHPPKTWRQRVRWAALSSFVLKVINTLMRSVGASIPFAGGAITEIKDGVEAALDAATAGPTGARKWTHNLRGLLRRRRHH